MSSTPLSLPRNTPKPISQLHSSESPAVAGEASTSIAAQFPISETLTREAQIELAAYYRAQHRGFVPAQELADWLEAEREIDTLSARAMI
jgi:DUF2934 family protein